PPMPPRHGQIPPVGRWPNNWMTSATSNLWRLATSPDSPSRRERRAFAGVWLLEQTGSSTGGRCL
ncbi:hypothetical protein ATR1_409c0001, partial [Acetobacter tropicalis]